jgi:hypothetical protein
MAEGNLTWIDGGDPAVGEISIEIHADRDSSWSSDLEAAPSSA